MIRVTRTQSLSRTIIRIDGRLDAEAVPEVRSLLETCERPWPEIDLTGLRSLDAEGRELLLALRARGHALTGGSMYIRTILREIIP